MNVTKLKLHNILSYKDEQIEFKEDGVYLIVGKEKGTTKSNGSGKSVIADTIAFVGWNVPRYLGSQIKSLMRLNTDKMIGEMEFLLGNDKYVISRTVTPKTNSVKISKNGKDLGLKIRDTQAYIHNLLGADYNIFRNTAYFKQGDMNAFSKLTPKEARELLMNTLQLNIYDNYEGEAKKKVGEIATEITELEYSISSNENLISEISKGNEIIDTQNINVEIKDLTNKLGKLNLNYEKIEKQKNKLTDSVNAHSDRASKISGKMAIIKNRLNKLTKLKNECPLCGNTLTQEDIAILQKSLKTLYNDLNKSYLSQMKLKAKYADEINKLNVGSYRRKMEEVSNIVTSKRLKLAEYQALSKKQKAEQASLMKMRKEINDDKLKLESLTKQRKNYEQLIKAFGRKGIQSYIIDSVLPEVEATINSLLKDLDGHLRVILGSEKTLANGKKADTLDIKILDRLGERSYYNYSGGEKTLIDFALRISLAIVLARRAGANIQTLILDECFVHLDSIGRNLMVKAIKSVIPKFGFKKVILISHHEEALDAGFKIIKVIKDSNGSHILKDNNDGELLY